MHVLAILAGVACVLLALLDAFQAVIMPRRAVGHFRITRLFYLTTWKPWCFAVGHVRNPRYKEALLSIFGPFSLVLLVALWALFLVAGFGLCFYGAGSPVTDPLMSPPDFRSDLYMSGTTLFTLGLGDVIPHQRPIRELLVLEAGLGLGFVALILGYFPVLYSAFSRREVNISLLDARAGSPPSAAELMRRHAFDGGSDALVALLAEWERWAAELLESHISYPLLCFYRSQHTNQSWLGALCAVLDTCALMVASVQDAPGRQAQLTFAMARHAVVDLSQIFELKLAPPKQDRLPPEAFKQLHDLLCQAGTRVARDPGSLERLNAMRAMYEPYVAALSRHLSMELPPFVSDRARRDNWQTVAQLRQAIQTAELIPGAMEQAKLQAVGVAHHDQEDHHIF